MKKLTLVLAFIFAFSFSVLADGSFPVGGRSCPSGQTCIVNSETDTEKSDETVFETVKYFLMNLKKMFN